MKKFLSILFIAILIISLFFACEEEDNGTPPELPPYESMFIDFSDFTVDSKTSFEKSVNSQTNYSFAAGNVGFWSLLLSATLVVPVAAFYNSFNYSPEYIGNATWEWNYKVSGFASNHTARLTGQIRTNNIKWEMYVAKEGVGGYDEFKWFEGTSDLDGNGGEWTLYHSYEFQEEVLGIEWSKSGDEISEITYTFTRELNDNRETEPFNGSYLTYGLQEGNYNAFYDIHFYNYWTQQFVDCEIEWSTTEYFGRVRAEYNFEDAEWHCWDSSGDDIECNK